MIRKISSDKEIKKFLGEEPLQTASIRVTSMCNLRCEQCYANAGQKMEEELSLSEIKKILDELKDLGVIRIFFTGGEPFCRRDMPEILKEADKRGFAMYLSTNATMLSSTILNKVSKLKHLRTFQISLDGLGELHDNIRGVAGCFKKSTESIHLAKKKLKNTKITVISTLMKKNHDYMTDLLKFCIELNIDTFGIVTLYPVKRSNYAEDISTKEKKQLFDKLAKEYKLRKNNTNLKLGLLIPPALIPKSLKEIDYGNGYLCSFPSLLGINANGDVAPCDGLIYNKNFILGNVRDKSLRNMWNSKIMKRLRAIQPSQISGVCSKCKHLDLCMGGCRARAYLETGNFFSPNPICESYYQCGIFPKESLLSS